MYHDFGATTSTNKYDSNGNICTGIGGYMDYQPSPNKWSTCSVEDFTRYYNSVNPWCLEELTTTAATTAPPPDGETGSPQTSTQGPPPPPAPSQQPTTTTGPIPSADC